MAFASREEAIHWAINNQWTKRNLTPEQERYLLGWKYTAEKNVNGGNRGNQYTAKVAEREKLVLASDDEKPPRNTADRIGRESGVSDHTVVQSEKYADALDALDERGVIDKSDVLSGKVKIPATRIVKAAKETDDEKAKAVITTPKRTTKEQRDQNELSADSGLRRFGSVVGCGCQKSSRVGAQT